MKIYEIYFKDYPNDYSCALFFVNKQNAQEYCDRENAKAILLAKQKELDIILKRKAYIKAQNVSKVEHNALIDAGLREGDKLDPLPDTIEVPLVGDIELDPKSLQWIAGFYFEEFDTEDDLTSEGNSDMM